MVIWPSRRSSIDQMGTRADIAHEFRKVNARMSGIERSMNEMKAQIQFILAKHGRNDADGVGTRDRIKHEIAENITAVVGLKEALVSEPSFVRYIWVLLFCSAIGATMYYLYETTDEFLTYPTATSVQLDSESEHRFPPMLLCPAAWFDAEKVYRMGLSRDALKYSLSYARDWFDPIPNVEAARAEFEAFYESQEFDTLLDYYKAISPDLNPKDSASDAPAWFTCRGCPENGTVPKTMVDQKICYVFHLKPVRRGFGVYSDFRFIEIQYEDKSQGLLDEPTDWELYFNPHLDIYVTRHPKLVVRTFYSNTIKFNVHNFTSLARSDSPCLSEETDGYSSGRCMVVCHNALYRAYLKCGLLWLANSTLTMSPNETCNYMDRYQPRNYTLKEFFESTDNANIDSTAANDCVNACPAKCERAIFDTRLQMQQSLTGIDKKKLQASNRTFIRVEIRHGDVYQGGTMVSKEMYSYSSTQLINNIGGTLGLFVGGTLMTLAQIVLFFVSHSCGRMANKRNA